MIASRLAASSAMTRQLLARSSRLSSISTVPLLSTFTSSQSTSTPSIHHCHWNTNVTPASVIITTTSIQVRSHATVADNDTSSSSKEKQQPTLKHVRSFPIVGSLIPALSGIPDSLADGYKFWPEMRKQYGDFYTIGFPSVGNPKDIFRTLYVVADPNEMVQVIQSGGAHPSGIVESLWVNRRWNEARGFTGKALLERGPEWKRIRSFMQTDLLHPESARGYVPAMIQAAQLASQGAPHSSTNLNAYLARTSFDLFSSVLFGELTQLADPTTPTDPEKEEFANQAAIGVGTGFEMLFSPYEMLMGSLKLESENYKKCFAAFDKCWEIGWRKIDNFVQRKERGELSEAERNSYLCRALDRQLEDDSVTSDEVRQIALMGLFAGIDTTSGVLGWNVFHVARSPHVQERLHEELVAAMTAVGSPDTLTVEALTKKHCPYLHACVRESHRLTPNTPNSLTKEVGTDGVTVYGVPLKKGDVVSLEQYSTVMNPDLVDEPNEYRPERWLPDAVKARKGTPKEIIDHSFFKEPFGQGARRCPGSRVAVNEIMVMMAQLVLDWKMDSPIKDMKDIVYHQRTTMELDIPELQFEPRN